MPYRRRSLKTSKRKPTTRKVSEPVKTYVKRAISARKPVRSHNVTIANGADVTTTVNFEDISEIAVAGAGVQDDPEIYRSQQQITPKKLLLSWSWVADSTAVVSNHIRVIVFRWKGERSEDTPSSADLWGDFFTGYVADPIFTSLDASKGQVLYDKMMTLPAQYNGSAKIAGHTAILGRKTINLKVPKISYLSNAGTGGYNHIYVAYVGGQATGANNSTLYLKSQLHYQE